MKQILLYSLLAALMLYSCKEDTIGFSGSGTITGKVVDAGTFAPVTHAKVTLTPSNNTVFSNEAGEFLFARVETGDYSVSAIKDGFLTAFKPATVASDLEVSVVFELEVETAGNRSPHAPQLIFPLDGDENAPLHVTLVWSGADPENDTLAYAIRIRNDRTSDVLEINNLKDTTYTLTNLTMGTRYYWQVSANDGINEDVWSVTHTFKSSNVQNNRFLFVRNVDGKNVIYSANGQGDEVQLTSSDENCWRPRKHPLTGKIAFLKSVDMETHLFTMNPDGSQQMQVTSLAVKGFNDAELDYSWSPDGGQLLYPHFTTLYTVHINGTGLEKIYETADGSFISECDWSQDGTLIALKTNNAKGYEASIFTIDVKGFERDKIISGIKGAAGGLNISVDKKFLLFTRDISGIENDYYRQLNTRLYIYYFETRQIVDISRQKEDGTLDLDPRISPDEARVIFVNTASDGKEVHKILFQDINPDEEDGVYLFNREELFLNATMPDWE